LLGIGPSDRAQAEQKRDHAGKSHYPYQTGSVRPCQCIANAARNTGLWPVRPAGF
jgi:hypothetical protein